MEPGIVPTSKGRGCTDPGWILNLVLLWTMVALIALCSIGIIPSNFIQAGSTLRLYGVMDYQGHFCGVDDNVMDLSFLWIPNESGTTYNSDLVLAPQDVGICVASCPQFAELRKDPYNILGSWTSPYATVDVAGVCRNVHSRLPGDIWRSVWVDIDLVWRTIVLGSTALPLVLFLVVILAYLSCFGYGVFYVISYCCYFN